MTETWLIFEVDFRPLGSQVIILGLVKPLVEKFKDEILTFHHLFEPQLLVRINADESIIEGEMIPFLRQKLIELNCRLIKLEISPNYNEKQDFGEGWGIALRVLEVGSQAAILKLDRPKTLGGKFDQIYFSHLFLNAEGLGFRQAWVIHYSEALGRLALDISNGNPEPANRIIKERMVELRQKASEIEVLLKSAIR